MKTGPKEILDIFDIWHSRKGLVGIYIVFVILITLIFNWFEVGSDLAIWYIVAYVIGFIGLWIIWQFTTNRRIIRGKYDLILCLFIEIDDDVKNFELIKIYQKLKQKYCEPLRINNVKIITYPINFFSDTKLKKHFNSNSSDIDACIKLNVHSGSIDGSIHQIQINKFNGFIQGNVNFDINGNESNILKEIGINNFYKNWKLLSNDIFRGTLKINDDLEDFLNHLIGILFLSQSKFTRALEFLEILIEDNQFKGENLIEGIRKKDPKILAKFRVIELVINLYLKMSEEHLYKDPKSALEILSKYENLKIETNFSATFYTRMAKMHYECGNLDLAIHYTNKVENITSNFYSIFFNRVFFSILKNDYILLTSNLKLIYHRRNKITFEVGIIAFLEKEIKKHPEKELLLTIVINFYQALFTDKSIGKTNLRNLMENLENTIEAKDLRNLINRVLS